MNKLLAGTLAASVAALVAYSQWKTVEISSNVVLIGWIEGEPRVLRSEVQGQVTSVLVREGDEVRAGSQLVRIDGTEAASRRSQQELAVKLCQVEVERAQRALEVTRRELAQACKLAQAEVDVTQPELDWAGKHEVRVQATVTVGSVSKDSLDEAEKRRAQAQSIQRRQEEALNFAQVREKGEVELAEASLAAATARLLVERERLHELDIQLAKHEVVADAPGTIQDRLIKPGELARPGTALIELIDEEDKWVRIYLPVAALASVVVGSPATVEMDALPGSQVPGAVEWISSRASFTPRRLEGQHERRTQQVYEARVRIRRGLAHTLRAGAEATVRIELGASAIGTVTADIAARR